MRDYSAARSVLSLVEFACWAGVLIGVIIAFSSVGVASRGFGTPGILAAIPGIAIGLLSLFGVALAQMGRAGVDTAEYGQQALKVARDQLEVSKQALKQGNAMASSFATLMQTQQQPENGATSATNASFADARKPTTEIGEAAIPPANDQVQVNGDTLTYKGQSAELIDGKWHLKGIQFESRELVKDYIDVFGRKTPKDLRSGPSG